MDSNAGAERLPSRALALALIWRLALANLIAGTIVVTYFVLSAELDGRVSRTQNLALTATVFVALASVFLVLAAVRSKQLFTPTWQWLDERRDPTPEEAAEVVRQPLRIALFPLRYWLAAAILNLLSFFLNRNGKAALFTFTGTVLGGLVASATGYFLADRLLRGPRITALARHDVSLPASRTVGRRLLLVWGLGSGIPLLGVVLTPLIVDHPDLPVSIPMAFLAGAGFLGGVLLTTMVARSIAEPVKDVRVALERVASGDLDARVVVDDAGELGQLQRGFNEMVEGLREREQLADLFGRHVGLEVAQRALQVGAALGGEVRSVSALFVDIIGSTVLARDRSAREVVAILNDFFAVVVSCVDAEGGWVNKFEGDGALCVFGAPIEQDDHAGRALRAARQLALALEDLAVRHPGLEAGIGVSSGEAVAGNVGAEQRLEYTVIGQPVNEAARLSEAAKSRPCRVLASRAAVEAAGDEASAWVDAGTLSLRGLAPDFAVWEPRS